ncbi:MAG: TolC family protein [Candidatus Brocadiaceae bacterium]
MGSAQDGPFRIDRALRLVVWILASTVLVWGSSAGAEEEEVVDLTLAECIEMAVRHNAAVQASRAEADAAEARRRAAFGAYLPSVNAAVSYTKLDERRSFSSRMDRDAYEVNVDAATWWSIAETAGTASANAAYDARDVDPLQTWYTARAQVAQQFPIVTTYPTIGEDVLEASIVLTQPLFTGGKIRHGHKMAEIARDIQKMAVGVTEDDVVLRVVDAYVGAVTSRRIREELEDLHRRLEALRDAVQAILDRGSYKSSMRDLTRLEVAMAETRQQVAESRRARNVALAALREATGLEENAPLRLRPTSLPGGTLSIELQECESYALRRRKELRQAEAGVELRRHGVSRAKAAFSPDVAAFAGGTYLTDDRDFANPDDEGELFAGVSMTVPLFEGLSRFARVSEARSSLRTAQHRRTEARRGVLLQVQEAYHSVRAAEQRLSASEKMVEQASELNKVTTAARSQHVATDYVRMTLLSAEPEIMEFKVVPDVPEELHADLTESRARIVRLMVEMELLRARARLARALGVRSLEEVDR